MTKVTEEYGFYQKLSANCSKDEKQGEGPGSCGGNRDDNKNDTELGENDKKVYGYQFFPTSTGLTTVPYIILKLTNVGGTTRTFPNAAYYVAVKAYKEAGTSAAPVTSFLPGNIYTVEDIVVSEKNIVTDPTKTLINVTVNVTVAKWSEKALNPDFGY